MNPRTVRQTALLVFLLALVVRTAWLDQFPPGLWLDEGLKGVDAWHTLHAGDEPATGFLLVYPALFPREPLLVWILSLVLSVLGPRVIVMRLTVALIGSLACVIFFRSVARVERDRGLAPALAAAFVLATLHWHAHFSRMVFRTNFVPLFGALFAWSAFAVAAFAARRGSTGWRPRLAWLGLGALAGAGFYTYLSWYFFVPVGLVWLWAAAGQEAPADTGAARVSWPRALGWFAAGGLLVALPIWVHYARFPQHLLARPADISPFKEGLAAGLRAMAGNLGDVLLMFNFRGDDRVVHNVPGSPILDPVWSLFFLAGLAATAHDALRAPVAGVRRRAVAWLAWLAFMSLPSVVSEDPSANMLRNLGATPAVAWLTARGWFEAMRLARQLPGKARRWAPWAVVALLVWGGGFQVWKLLVRHPREPEMQQKFSGQDLPLAQLCTPDPSGAPIFVHSAFRGGESYRFQFLTIGRADVRPLDLATALARDADGTPPRDHRILCTFFTAEDWTMTARLPNELQRLFPTGKFEPPPVVLYGRQTPGRIYRIPAQALLSPNDARRVAHDLAASASKP